MFNLHLLLIHALFESFQCECGNIMWVIMKLGYGSPLKVPKQDDETPDIDPGISYEPGLTTTMVAFDVAGAEPINYQMGGGWQVDMVTYLII